jgi:hypothetical protein
MHAAIRSVRSTELRSEVGNALGRLEADRPKLAAATQPGNMARLVSTVLYTIDVECTSTFGLWTLEERRKYLHVGMILRADGITLLMRAKTGGGKHTEPNPHLLRTKRKGELLEIPSIMDLVERIIVHAEVLLDERGLDATDLVPGGKRIGRSGVAVIDFFDGDDS